ncbi:MAG: PPC domain-containing protein [Planctomycetia bacterium]
MTRCRWALLLGLAVPAGTALGQTSNSYPMLMSLRPTAAVVGATTDHELSARYNLAGASAVIVTGDGVFAEVVPPVTEKPEDREKNDVAASTTRLRIRCDASAVPGIRDVRVITPHGASTVGQLVVVCEGVTAEQPDNDTAEKAQAVTLPATLCGALEKGEDVDFWRIRVEAAGPWVFHLVSQRLQNRLHDMQSRVDPLLTLRSLAGQTIAASDNALAGDPLLAVAALQPGEYLLEVRDVRYQGNADWTYAIEASGRPFVTAVHPLAMAPGATVSTRLFTAGPPLPGPVPFTLPADAPAGVRRVAPMFEGRPLGGVGILVTTDPITVEPVAALPLPQAADGTDAPAGAAAIVGPAVICGELDSPGQADRFAFTAKAGEAFSFEVHARRLGSNLDAKLRVLKADGGLLAEADDATYQRVLSADPYVERFAAPADGTYLVEIRDLHGRGGAGFPYALRIGPSSPSFVLEVDTDKTLLAPGLAAPIYVRALRRGGFTGDIDLTIDGLPAGVTAVTGRILATGNDGCLWLQAAPDAPAGWGNVTITGQATVTAADGSTSVIQGRADPLQEIYMPGGGRGHYPVDLHTVSVAKPMDIRGITVSSTAVVLKPGDSQRLDITVERAPDYKGNITLDMMLQHLETPYGNPLPKGVKVDGARSKTLLTAGESVGHITLTAAADAPPVERQLVPVTVHATINFVMKHTFASAPVLVTVTQP